MSGYVIESVAFLLSKPKLPSFYDIKEHFMNPPKHQVGKESTLTSTGNTGTCERRGRYLPPVCHSQWTTNVVDLMIHSLSAFRLVISADQTAHAVCQKFTW